jgi:hypothetical protein
MSDVDTKWKKKNKMATNVEGLVNKEEKIKTTRIEKDNTQNKMLYELKMRIKNIQNKRNGFTKLPHLTDIVDDSDKEEFKESNPKKKILEEEEEDDKEEFKESNLKKKKKKVLDDDDKEEFKASNVKKQPATFFDNVSNFFLGRWDDMTNYPHGATLGLSYSIFLIIYLQIYHLNFKDDIMALFPGSYEFEEQIKDKSKPSDLDSIQLNIMDSLSKSLVNGVEEEEHVSIKHNKFLKFLNYISRADGGIFLKFILIPAKIVVAITQNLIPNLKLVPFIGDRDMFTAIFALLFSVFYASTFAYSGISKERKKIKKGKGGWVAEYYARIPISYFVTVGIIIINAFGFDTARQMGDGSYFTFGAIGIIGRTLIRLFALSMSIVLSGFAAIPLLIFALMWIIAPDGLVAPHHVVERWSNSIRDNYWLPEWSACADNAHIERFKWIIRKLWNNKILISTLIIIDLVIKLNYGRGNLADGIEKFNETSSFWSLSIPFIIAFSMIGQETKRDKPLYRYLLTIFEPAMDLIRAFTGEEVVKV